MASRQALRKAWWQVHKWGGLILMALFIPLGLTGVVLAWDDAIDHALNPQRYAVHGAPTLAASAYAASAAQVLHPDERIATMRYPEGEGPVKVIAQRVPQGHGDGDAGAADLGQDKGLDQAKGHAKGAKGGRGAPLARITLWLDPGTARVLDVERGNSGLVRFSHTFHSNLFVVGFGRTLVGLLGVVMFLMALGGVWLWLPPVGRWMKGLRWQRGDRKLDTNLHHRIGFWIALPLAVQAFTGVWIAWPQMMGTVGLAGRSEGPRMVPAAHTMMTADQAVAAARAGMPGMPSSIGWPTGKEGPWRIALDGAQGATELTVDDATGAVAPAPKKDGGLSDLVRHIHDGTAIGWGWRALMVLWGLAPTVLGVTGLLMWLRGRRWRAKAAKRTRNTREPVAAG